MELTAEWELQKRLMKFNTQQQKPYPKKKETHLGKKRPKNKKRKRQHQYSGSCATTGSVLNYLEVNLTDNTWTYT